LSLFCATLYVNNFFYRVYGLSVISSYRFLCWCVTD